PNAIRTSTGIVRGRGATSAPACIDVPGIGGMRQLGKPARDCLLIAPIIVFKNLAFAQGGVEACISKPGTTRDAFQRDIALDGGEFKRECWHQLRKPRQ